MRTITSLSGLVLSMSVATAYAQTPRLAMEEMMVPSEPGIEIYVRSDSALYDPAYQRRFRRTGAS